VVESLERGGLERVVVTLARQQATARHDVKVACLFTEGVLAPELRAAGIRVTCLRKRPGIDLRAIRALRALYRAEKAEIVHSHNAVANYYAAAAAVGSSVRLINTRHGMGALASGRKERLFKLSVARTAAVIAVCQAARQMFAANGLAPDAKLQVVLNGIDLQGSVPGPAEALHARRALNLGAADFVIGTVGRLNGAKNHMRLLDAFAIVSRNRPESRLVIIGGGELRADLERHAAHLNLGTAAVLFTGDRNDARALLPAFDLFAMTSDTEGYSLALLEAGAAGLPCVVSNVGGNAEIVQQGVTGQVVASNDPAAFAADFEMLARDTELRRRMGRQAREWVERHGSVAAMAADYERLYTRINALASREALV
jgi:glycosyltransferase involved in cell wall biosynthesis